jgi:hypothetical protein
MNPEQQSTKDINLLRQLQNHFYDLEAWDSATAISLLMGKIIRYRYKYDVITEPEIALLTRARTVYQFQSVVPNYAED